MKASHNNSCFSTISTAQRRESTLTDGTANSCRSSASRCSSSAALRTRRGAGARAWAFVNRAWLAWAADGNGDGDAAGP
jgi:hypothetical protein